MFSYFIYGLTAQLNIQLPFLEQEKVDTVDLYIHVEFIDISDSTVSWPEKKNAYFLDLSPYGIYYVHSERNRIDCYAPNLQSFFSTVFNVPFSIYFLFRNELLLHTSSMLYKGSLLCFSADKGKGKSTLVSYLNHCKELRIYADDTLRVAKGGLAYRANHLIKLTDETVNSFQTNTNCLGRNVTQKQYFEFKTCDQKVKCQNIIVIERDTSNTINFFRIENMVEKKLVLSNAIVGNQFFDKSLLLSAMYLIKEFYGHFSYHRLYIPSTLTELAQKKDKIAEMVIRGL